MGADAREDKGSPLGRREGMRPAPSHLLMSVCKGCWALLHVCIWGKNPEMVPLCKGKNCTSVSIFWCKFLSSWKMVSVGCQCHSLEERNLTCDWKCERCALQAQDFAWPVTNLWGLKFFFFKWIWSSRSGFWSRFCGGVNSWGMQRLSCSFLCVQAQLWGNSFCPDYQIFAEVSKIIFSLGKYVLSISVCTTVIY